MSFTGAPIVSHVLLALTVEIGLEHAPFVVLVYFFLI
jgi:hypothetical protein